MIYSPDIGSTHERAITNSAAKKLLFLLIIILIMIVAIPKVFGYKVSDFILAEGDKDSEDLTCLGKDLPKGELRVGFENTLAPFNNKMYCCQRVTMYNPFWFTSIDLDTNKFNPYIDKGKVDLYHKELTSEAFTDSKGVTINRDYEIWSKGVKTKTIGPDEKETWLVCGEKQNILERNKWGILASISGTSYDKDPVYNPGGTNAFHPNVSVGFLGQNGSNMILTNLTLNLTANYTDYCSLNPCVANDTVSEVYRFDNALTATNGSGAAVGGGVFTQGLFGGSTGARFVNKTKPLNISIDPNTNFTGFTNYGFGGWFNVSAGDAHYVLGMSDGSLTEGIYISNAGNVECDVINASNGGVSVTATGGGTLTNSLTFAYCQKNASELCAYMNGAPPTCVAHVGGAHGKMPHPPGSGANWTTGFSGGDYNTTYDELQFRKTALNNANITQLYYDGLHILRPNDFSSNNSRCEFYIQNTSGTFIAKNQTLGFNITTCTLNNSDTTQFLRGNNVSANFTPVNNYEAGTPKQAGITVFITSNPPSFNQTLPSPVGINIGNPYFLKVNCSSQINENVNYTDNTALYTINLSTGIINTSFVEGQGSNNTIQITCTDGGGSSSQTYTLNIQDKPVQFFFKTNISNTTSFETDRQVFYINASYNTSAFNLTANFIYNSTVYAMTLYSSTADTGNEYSGFNNTLFTINVTLPLILVNDSNITYQYNLTLTNNSGNQQRFFNSSQKIIFAYNIQNFFYDQNYTEGSNNISINFSVGKQFDTATITGIIEFNRTNKTGSKTSTTTLDNFKNVFEIGFVDVLNTGAGIFGYINITFNGITRVMSSASTNITISQISITNCTGTASYPALNVTIRDEADSAVVAAATFTSTITSYVNQPYNRTFSLINTNDGDFQICYRPVFDTVKSIIDAQYTNSTYDTRFYFNTITLTNLSQTTSIYLLKNNSANKNAVKITVNDQNDEPLEERTVEVYSYNFGTGNTTFLTSQNTNFNGEASFNLVTADIYYSFVVKNSGVTEFSTDPFIILSPYNYVFRISIDEDKTTSNIINLYGVLKSLTFTNSTKNVTFNYTDTNNIIGTVCMTLTNGTLSNYTWFYSCTDSDNGYLSFSVGQNKSKFVAYVTAIMIQDGMTYYWDSLAFDTTEEKNTFGYEGVMLTFFVVGIVSFAMLFNPSAAILGAFSSLALMGLLQFHALNLGASGFVMGAVAVGIIFIYLLKT